MNTSAFTPQEALVEANRCLYCYDAPCTLACPTHIDVPKFIKKIASLNLRGSALTILDANILGASCARVCPVDVLCEGSCVMHRYNREPIEIGRLQRFAMDTFYDSDDRELPKLQQGARRLRVACIGAGPASLACAAELVRRGHSVTIFEAKALAGGLNTYGVADYKLTAAEALREVEFIRSLGVEFRTGESVDAKRLDEIATAHDAVFIGTGLGGMKALGIPGEDLPGVVDALTFIADNKTDRAIKVGRRVAVIGGGNTAIDAAIAAKRRGAEKVVMLYRQTEREMPAFAFEYEHAKQEGVEFRWQARPLRIFADGVECEGFTIECDMVIPAIGQGAGAFGNNSKFFTGGDMINGGREVVDAVADGKRAAQRIEALAHA